MFKREDDDGDVDDEVRTTVPSQNHATATLSTEESFLRTLYLELSPHISREVWGGQEIDGQHDTNRQSQLDSQLPARTLYC
jgi:hypothetical protein